MSPPDVTIALPRGRDLTGDDLQSFPEDSRRYELIEGTLIVTPAPSGQHQVIVGNLYAALRDASPPALTVIVSPFDYRPEPTTTLEPDLLVVPCERARDQYVTEPPVLVVEVLSPLTRRIDLGTKRLTFEALGVPSYWLVDPDEPSVTVLELRDGRYVDAGRAIGEDRLAVDRPFPVTIVPAALLEP